MSSILRLFKKRSKKIGSPVPETPRIDSAPVTPVEDHIIIPNDAVSGITSILTNPSNLDFLARPSVLDYSAYLGVESPGILDLGSYDSKLFDIGVRIENPDFLGSFLERTAPISLWWDYVDSSVSVESMFAPSSIDSIVSQEEIFTDLLKDRQNVSRQYFSHRLLYLFETEYFEYGLYNNADKLVAEYMETDPIQTKEWLNSLLIDNFARPSVLTKLLRILANFDYQDIYPEGPTMAALTLHHRDLEVQECSVRAFESWRSIKSIEILDNLKVADGWLQKYIDKVVMYLKRDFNVVPRKED